MLASWTFQPQHTFGLNDPFSYNIHAAGHVITVLYKVATGANNYIYHKSFSIAVHRSTQELIHFVLIVVVCCKFKVKVANIGLFRKYDIP